MKRIAWVVLFALVAGSAVAQRHKLGEINTQTEEGKLLQSIGTEEDPARKVELMESFVGKFGNHEGAGWVWSQLQPAYIKAGSFDKAIAAGDKLVSLDPMDLAAAYGNLKAAEGKKDGAAVAKWAASTSAIARKTVEQPKGADQSDEDYKGAVDYAKQVDTYSEYSLYSTALTEPDPKTVMLLAETLEKQNPMSQYVPMVLSRYSWAARELKSPGSAVAMGERALERGQMNEDLLLLMADYQMNLPPGKKDEEKIIQYSTKLIEYISAKPKPEGVSEADWQKRKDSILGIGNWMAGTTYGSQKKFAQADKSLRTALPLIQDNEQLMAGALFYLGLSNYQMGRGKNARQVADAVKFMQQCAAIKSPYQGQAAKNAAVMRKETGGK